MQRHFYAESMHESTTYKPTNRQTGHVHCSAVLPLRHEGRRWHWSLHQVLQKLGGNCMRNANKYIKILYSAMASKMEK